MIRSRAAPIPTPCPDMPANAPCSPRPSMAACSLRAKPPRRTSSRPRMERTTAASGRQGRFWGRWQKAEHQPQLLELPWPSILVAMPSEPIERRNWTDAELDLIIADYFAMLDDEAAGKLYSKAEHNRLLQGQIDRTQGSIEFKHQNISAVLLKLGLPRIVGYLPAANYQRAIVPAIERYLSTHPAALHPERIVEGIADRQGLFVDKPPPLLPIAPPRPDMQRLIRKFNPVERDFRNRKLGREGEELVFHFERQRLQQQDRADLARKVRWVSEELGDGAGYD